MATKSKPKPATPKAPAPKPTKKAFPGAAIRSH